MKVKIVLLCILAVLGIQSILAWGGPIYKTVKIRPAGLSTALGNLTTKQKMVTNIACFNVSNGRYADCSFDIQIKGLVQPDTDVLNNGGHSHGGTHPVGDLQVIYPITGAKSKFISGWTNKNYVNVAHEIPEVSGKIETLFNLFVEPGWHTVSPESCNGNRASWCFLTTVDVGVMTDLLPLTDPNSNPGLAYIRVRTPMGHPDKVAYSGTINTLFFLNNIAISYKDEGFLLSVNDMSLPKGGLFDVDANYKAPHNAHRTGESVDINKNFGNCLKNTALRKVIDEEMPIKTGSRFSDRYFPSRFLCETGEKFKNSNNIHIDFDGMSF